MSPSLVMLKEFTSSILLCDHELKLSIVEVENGLLELFHPRKILNVPLLQVLWKTYPAPSEFEHANSPLANTGSGSIVSIVAKAIEKMSMNAMNVLKTLCKNGRIVPERLKRIAKIMLMKFLIIIQPQQLRI